MNSPDHLELGIPNGWFAVSWSKDLEPREVKRIRYFDQELVLFRTVAGKARVLSAYCPHRGAHLGEGGRVIGETLRCPFHGWQYDGESGACVKISYCEKIPPRARVRAWDVVERNRMICVWHDADGKPPSWEVPVIPQLEDPDWTEPRFFELTIPVHMQDMAENNLDPVHFRFVHSALEIPETETSIGEDGRFLRATSWSNHEVPGGSIRMELVRDTWGLGLSSVESRGIPKAGLFMFTSTTPIDHNHTVSHWALTATRNIADTVGQDWFDAVCNGVLADRQIWIHKIHPAEPVYCEGDTFLVQFRRWARQFYSSPE